MGTTEKTLGELIIGAYDYHPPERGEVRQGILLSVEKDKAVVDMGVKREAIVPKRDLELLGEEALAALTVGDEVAVYVMRPEDPEGNLLVSLNLAQQEADWTQAQELLESGEVRKGEVVGHNRGGLLVSFGHLQAFLPQSQIAVLRRGLSREERMERLPPLVGKKLPFKVIEVDRSRRRLVLSNRSAIRAWRRVQVVRLLEELTEGDTVCGTVSSLCDFGAFVDLGGADGLIHISELAWHRVEHPSEVLEEGQEVEVYVLRLDQERNRIGLSLKRLQPDPWSLVDSKYAPGDVVEGEVRNVVSLGAFVRVEDGVEGLVHVSEMPDEAYPLEAPTPGEQVLVRVLHVQPVRRRMGLSLRQVGSHEREEWLAQREEKPGAQSSEQIDEPVGQGQESEAGEKSDGDGESSGLAPVIWEDIRTQEEVYA